MSTINVCTGLCVGLLYQMVKKVKIIVLYPVNESTEALSMLHIPLKRSCQSKTFFYYSLQKLQGL